MLYGHGDDASLQTFEIRDDFSLNIRSDGPPDVLISHLRSRVDIIARYPEPDARTYRRLLAASYHIAESQLLITAGGTAAIYLVAQTHRARRSLIISPTFSEYADAAAANAHHITHATREELAASESTLLSSADIVWLCNPNNPTGENTSAAKLLALVDRHPKTLFVIDQAFADFCAAEPIAPFDTTARPNLILLRSFTKTLGIPGLRLGCIISTDTNIAALAHSSQPWSVNSLAIEAGLFHLRHPAAFTLPLDDILAHTRTFMRAIDALPNYSTRPSATNFFLVALKKGRAADLKEHLINTHRILVRDASNFVGLAPNIIRVSTKTPWQNTRLAQALAGWKP